MSCRSGKPEARGGRRPWEGRPVQAGGAVTRRGVVKAPPAPQIGPVAAGSDRGIRNRRMSRRFASQLGWLRCTLACGGLGMLAVVAGVTSSRAEVVDRVIAAVDGKPITLYDLEHWMEQRGFRGEPTREALDAYVTEQLLADEAKAAGISVSDEDIDRYITEVKAQRGMNEAAFDEALRREGMTLEAYRRNVQSEIAKSQLVGKEVHGRVSVSSEEVRRHYDQHAGDYALAERVHLRMILIPVPPETPAADVGRAEMFVHTLHSKLQNGADFAEMARLYSAGPGASEGGDLGWFERGQIVKPVEDVAFRLKAGVLSNPIRSPAGFHLLKVEERQGSVQQPFEAVADQIREELYRDALQRRYEAWMRDGLREGHHVEVLWWN